MKKKNVINLIRYYVEQNDSGFKAEAYEIAEYFDKTNDTELAEYIIALLSNVNTFVPQMNGNENSSFERVEKNSAPLYLPEDITNDLMGIVNAVSYNVGINKFLFQGAPGTGKTEAVKQLARILGRDIFMVDFSIIVDSKLGQTQKNIANMFKEINSFINPDKVLILLDEIDAIALNRTDSNDLREMGRATSAMLKGFDNMNHHIVLVATTNLYNYFDKALARRFDSIIDFNRYSKADLLEISENILNNYLKTFKLAKNDIRLFRKILSLYDVIPYPGELKNIIKTSIAFSNPNDEGDYFRRLYYAVTNEKPTNLKKLYNQNFTYREMEVLTKIPRSTILRELKGEILNE